MYFLSWIVIGLMAGWLVGRTLKGEGYGTFMDIAMGIGGAVAGGFLMGFSRHKGPILTTLLAMMGAVILTLLTAYANGRRIYVREG